MLIVSTHTIASHDVFRIVQESIGERRVLVCQVKRRIVVGECDNRFNAIR